MVRINFTKKKDLIAVFIILIFLIIYTSPLLINIHKGFSLFPKNMPRYYVAYTDWLFFLNNLLEYNQLPIRTHLVEGGIYLFCIPLDISANPLSYILIILRDAIKIENFSWFLFYLFGALSMYYLCRRILHYNIYGSIFSAIVFSMGGHFAYLHADGFSAARSTLLLPLLVGFLFKMKTDKRYIFFAAAILGFISLEGCLFVFIIIFSLFLFFLLDSLRFRHGRLTADLDYAKNLVFVCALAFLLSAVKHLPVLISFLDTNIRQPELYAEACHAPNTLSLFYKRLLIPAHSGPGTMYMGYVPVILAIFSMSIYFRQMIVSIICLLIAIMLSFGPNSFIDLHSILWRFPIYNIMHEVSKYYSLIITFFIAISAGKFFTFILKRKKIYLRIIAIILIFWVFSDLLWNNIGYFNLFNTSFSPAPSQKKNNNFHVLAFNAHQGNESILDPLSYFLLRHNIGLMNLYDPGEKKTTVVPKYFLLPKYCFLMPYTSFFVIGNPLYKKEAFFLGDNSEAKFLKFSPCELNIEAKTTGQDLLIVNQNYDKYWRANQGKVVDYNGLLAVKFDRPINGVIRLTYFALDFFIGLIISILSLAGSLIFVFRYKKGNPGHV